MIKAAIVILSYNNYKETLQPCLKSIYKAKTDLPYHVVIVDNHSTDGTVKYLKSIEGKWSNLTILFEKENHGFAGGNNLGIKAVEAEHYVLLNNDTEVTDHWLDKLVELAESSDKIGMVGPVSNSVGNEQMIYTKSKKKEEIIAEGLKWTEVVGDDSFETQMLGFYCVLIKKSVIDKIGLLDERFGLGIYEDDDFCLRAKKAGFKLMCHVGVFVYHFGNFSFGKLKTKELSNLHRKNREYFEKKNKVEWKSSFDVGSFRRLFEQYIEQVDPDDAESVRKMLYKMQNRLEVLRNLDVVATKAYLLQSQDSPPADASDKMAKKYEELNEHYNYSQKLIESLEGGLNEQKKINKQLKNELRVAQNRLQSIEQSTIYKIASKLRKLKK